MSRDEHFGEALARVSPPRAWALLVVCATLTRVLQLWVEPAYLHPDALLQALEPAHRAVWGHGIETWEWQQGLRSWLWPGMLAGAMKLSAAAGLAGPGVGMQAAVGSARAVAVLCDVLTVVFATRLAAARGGTVAAVFTGGVLAMHPAFFVMGAQPLIDVPATTALVVTCEQAFGRGTLGRRRAVAVGAGLVLTAAVRIQLAPAVLVVAAALLVGIRRGTITPSPGSLRALCVAAATALLGVGLLDALTLGGPFASSIAYARYNLGEGGTAFGSMPATRYVRDAWRALGPLAVALPILAGLATRRAAPIVAVALAVLLPHQLLSYRVWRFIHPGVVVVVPLAGIGLATLVRVRPRAKAVVLGLVAAASLAELGWATQRGAPWSTSWLFDRGGMEAVERSRSLNRALLEISGEPKPRAVAQAVLPAGASGAYALLGHDVPLVPALDAPVSPQLAATVDVWIVPTSPPPPGFERIWNDPVAGVEVHRRDR